MIRTRSSLAFVLVLAIPGIAAAEPMIGLSEDGTALVPFDSASADNFGAEVAITGLPAGTELLSIDSQAGTGALYGLGEDSVVYKITSAGVASPVNVAAFTPALDRTEFAGFDFNPLSGQARIVTDKRQNLRFDLGTGAAVADSNFTYANAALGVLRSALSPINISAHAYSPGAASKLYAVDANWNELVEITAGGASVADLNALTPVPAPLAAVVGGATLGITIDKTEPHGFDISPTGSAFLVASVAGGEPSIYGVALSGDEAGKASLIGLLDDTLRDFTAVIAPVENPDGGSDGGSTSSSGGSSGASSGGSSGGSSGASSGGSSGSSGTSGSSGASGSGGASGTSGTSGANGTSGDLGIGGLSGGGCSAAESSDMPWGLGLVAAAVGLVMTRLRRRK